MRARRRIIYDELMLMQLGLGFSKRLRDGRLTAPVMRLDKLLDERIRKRFPFELTAAQQNAVWEIVSDLASGRPMNRLLQGDVGSGKTVVALYAMLRRRREQAAGGPARADRSAGRAALPDAVAVAGRLERRDRPVHRPHQAAEQGQAAEGTGRRQGPHRRRHAGADPGGRRVRQPRPGRGRRAAQARRPPAGGAQGQGPLAALPGDDRHADPADAGAVATSPTSTSARSTSSRPAASRSRPVAAAAAGRPGLRLHPQAGRGRPAGVHRAPADRRQRPGRHQERR